MRQSKYISPILYSLLTMAAQKKTLAIETSVKRVIQICKATAEKMSLLEDNNVVEVAEPTFHNPNIEVKETGII